jgi:hypothetical protein
VAVEASDLACREYVETRWEQLIRSRLVSLRGYALIWCCWMIGRSALSRQSGPDQSASNFLIWLWMKNHMSGFRMNTLTSSSSSSSLAASVI